MSEFAWIGTTGLWVTTTNWSPNGTPGAGDIIVLDGRAVGPLTGNPATSVQLAAIKQYMSCPAIAAFGTPAAPIACFADNVEVGMEATDGSSGGGAEFHINAGTNAGGKMVVYNSKSAGTSGQDPVTLKTGTPGSGTHSVYVAGGTLGIATAAPADAATIATIGMTGGRLNLGSGMVTGWTLTTNGTAKAFVRTATSGAIIMYGGEVTTEGVGLIATVTLYGGTYFCNHRVAGSASITTLTLGGSAPTSPTIDFRGDPAAITVTNYTEVKGRELRASSGQVTVTTPTQPSLGNSTTRTVSLS